MKFPVSTIASLSFAAASAHANPSLTGTNEDDIAPNSEIINQNGDAYIDPFVPLKIQKALRSRDFIVPLNNEVLTNTESNDEAPRSQDDQSHDLGILANDHGHNSTSNLSPQNNVHQWDRKLQGTSCFDYCLGFGDRPVIQDTTVSFRDQVNAFPFDEPSPINCWDTSLVTNMSYAFADKTSKDPNNQGYFNSPLDCWDTSAVTSMRYMFSTYSLYPSIGTAFNQPVKSWNTSAVTDMRGMFRGSSFNQPVDLWDVSAVTNLKFMFYDARAFNQCISTWPYKIPNTGRDGKRAVFRMLDGTGCPKYAESLCEEQEFCRLPRPPYTSDDSWGDRREGPWCQGPALGCSAPPDLKASFCNVYCKKYGDRPVIQDNAISFQKQVQDFLSDGYGYYDEARGDPINCWNVSSVTRMDFAFSNAPFFNSPLNCWDTSAVTNMRGMFLSSRFSKPVNSWDTSAVTDMSRMFSGAFRFSQKLDAWDTSAVRDMTGMFDGSGGFQKVDSWNTSAVTDMTRMFANAQIFNQNLNSWDTSAVTSMSGMFDGARNFNQPLDSWNTSAVRDMSKMFVGAYDRGSSFNQPVNSWDTSAVTSMRQMFEYADSFNQPVESWNTSAVRDMVKMFDRAYAFNQPLDSWNTTAVTDMSLMFYRAKEFNQAVGSWNTSAVSDMGNMFKSASAFNQELGSWDTSMVTDMVRMFSYAEAFNQSVDSWDTSAVTNMARMFSSADVFNQPVDSWDTSAVTDMNTMFDKAYAFNQPVDSWDTSAVTDMGFMFSRAAAFDQSVESWDTSAVTDMDRMFYKAFQFNQPVDSWDTSSVNDMFGMFREAKEFNQCVSTWAAKTNNNVNTERMFGRSGCPNSPGKVTPDPTQGPWCQRQRDGCSAPPTVSPSLTTSPIQNYDDLPTSFPSGNPSQVFSSCSEYCGQFGDRPVIEDSTVSFQKQVQGFLETPQDSPINCWNVSSVRSMASAFELGDLGSFNSPLNCWDTSAVTDMSRMFSSGTFSKRHAFNQPVGSWDTSAVTDMSYMFFYASSFNQAVDSWDTSAVTDMSGMFEFAFAFNQPVYSWNTTAVIDMSDMFLQADEFNQAVDSWDTSAVTDMEYMFFSAVKFNQCISTWASKTPDTFAPKGTFNMLEDSGCQDKYDPNPNVGPWCQGCGICSASPTLASCCYDAPNSARFDFVNNKNQTRKSCSFIGSLLVDETKNFKNKICNLDAKPPQRGNGIPKETKIRNVCPRTCGICPDQCKDSNRKFLLEGKQRKCSFLDKRRPAIQKELCNTNVGLTGGNKRKPKLKSLCQASCAKVGIGRCAISFEEIVV